MLSSVQTCNNSDFDKAIFRFETRDDEQSACGHLRNSPGLLERRVNARHSGDILPTHNVDYALHDIAEGPSAFFQCGFDVVVNLISLTLDIAFADKYSFLIQRNHP